jgi:xylan 1,4-beta-xylosidase
MREAAAIFGIALAVLAAPGAAAPTARFEEVSYSAETADAPAGEFRNPILPGFHPDPSVVRVGDDFYLVNSTFAWFPGIPVFHSRDLVNWRLIGHAIDRPGMLDFSGLSVDNDGVYAPAITWHAGKFYIFNTCVRCAGKIGGNFYVTATDPTGPWSDPVGLDFEGIDPSLFVDDGGRAWVLNNGAPEGTPRYDGHRAIWIQQIDLAAGEMIGPRKVLVDGGADPAEKPIWAEGPHLYKVDGWYYLMAAEGGTADQHSETIYRSRAVDGPYEPGPVNPILTQRDLPPDRPDRVEAAGHADLVRLDDGSWWGVFLATRPFAGQSTLLGRETWLLPVTWQDGWPSFLAPGQAVPVTVPRPNLPAGEGADWARWADRFDAEALSGEWLQMRASATSQWYVFDREADALQLVARPDAAGGLGQPSYLARRLRHPVATVTTRLAFAPERDGDFAGLLALIDESHFLALGIEQVAGRRVIAVRKRATAEQPESGELVAQVPLAARGEVELSLAIEGGEADLAWRPAGGGRWQSAARDFDVEYLSSSHSGLFTGVLIGPYAVSGE